MIKVRVVRTVRNGRGTRKLPREFLYASDALNAYDKGRISKETLDKYEFHTYIKSFESVEDLVKWLNDSYDQYVPYLKEDLTEEEFQSFYVKIRSVNYKSNGFRNNGTNWKRFQKEREKYNMEYPYGYLFR